MSVKLFFGLPGCGKTTILTYFAVKYTKKHSPYKNVYCNVGIDVPGVIHINNSDVGQYQLEDGVLLIDEASLFADSRDYKNFNDKLLSFFLLHRHYRVDIILFNQGWDAVDKRIRVITDRVYYVYKTPFLGKWFSSYYRIPYDIIIPDPNKKGASGEKLGDIIQGYCKPPIFLRIFSHKVYRPKYYKYFDSWVAPNLPPLPQNSEFISLDSFDSNF